MGIYSKKKPALYYAILPGYSSQSSLGRIMVVTSEKGPQVYGRDYQYGNPTHRSKQDILAKFPDEGSTLRALSRVADVEKEYAIPIKRAEVELRTLRKRERDAISVVVKEEEESANASRSEP